MSQSPTPLEILKNAKVFGELGDDALSGLVAESQLQSFGPGSTIIEAGGSGDTLYVFHAGTARVEVEGAGKTIKVAELGPGDFCGEVAAVFQQRRSATVVADGNTEVLAVAGEALRKLLDDTPALKQRLEETGLNRIEEDIDAYLAE